MVTFGAWCAIDDVATMAPDGPGVLQVRAEGLRVYPRGRTAMLLYAHSRSDETLRQYLRERGAAAVARAAAVGARWIRFAPSPAPEREGLRLMRRFVERFGAVPAANEDGDARFQ